MVGIDGNKWKSGSCIFFKIKVNRNILYKLCKGG